MYLLFIVIIILVFMFSFNRIKNKLLFYPDKNFVWYPKEYKHIDLNIKNRKTGNKLHGWFILHPDAKKNILLCHGNAGNVSHRKELIELFYSMNCSICVFDYAGFGISEGTPSEETCYDDAMSFWEYISNIPGDRNETIIVGESIGSGPASHLAHRVNAKKLIIIAGFTSIKDMIPHVMPVLSIFKFFVNDFPTYEYLQKFEGFTLILHSKDDDIIPYDHAIQNAKIKNCNLVEIKGDHNNRIYPHNCIKKLTRFLNL